MASCAFRRCVVKSRRPERLLTLLTAAGVEPAKARELAGGTDLDDWLRNSFFEEHCKLFHNRPFVWHVWDGRKRDGFHALVNYHKLCGVSAGSPHPNPLQRARGPELTLSQRARGPAVASCSNRSPTLTSANGSPGRGTA